MQLLGQRLVTTRLVPGVRPGPRDPRFLRGLAGAGLGGAALVLTLGTLFGLGWALLPAMAGYGLLLAGIRASVLVRYPHARFGACNTVTLWRAAMVVPLTAALLAGEAAGPAVAVLAGASLLMDGLDGWLARRSGLVSDFGARFDMEVDAALGLALALHAVATGPLGLEVLLLGLPRYVFLLAALPWPWLAAPLPPSLRRKAVCVIQLAVLILLQLPQPEPVAQVAAGTATALLLGSFAVDIRLLWKLRR